VGYFCIFGAKNGILTPGMDKTLNNIQTYGYCLVVIEVSIMPEGAIINLALSAGNLRKKTAQLFGEAGYELQTLSERDYNPCVHDDSVKIKMFRSQEVPGYVAPGRHGNYDLGITGLDRLEDWTLENDCSDSSELGVMKMRDLKYGNVKTVLAVPIDLEDVNSFETLIQRFPECRIATEYPNLVKRYLRGKGHDPNMILPHKKTETGSPITVIYSWGATEAKPPEDADAIVENMETRHTLRDNDLKYIDVVMDYSTAMLIANRDSLTDFEKAKKIKEIEKNLMAVVNARNLYHLWVNVPPNKINEALEILPALDNPTVTPPYESSSSDVLASINTFVPRDDFDEIKEQLEGIGGSGIVPGEEKRVFIKLGPRIYEQENTSKT